MTGSHASIQCGVLSSVNSAIGNYEGGIVS